MEYATNGGLVWKLPLWQWPIALFACYFIITYWVDGYLFAIHYYFHRQKTPRIIRAIHRVHHDKFLEKKIFTLHPLEFLINFLPGAILVWLLLGLYGIPVVTFWAIFEAARGHGHFLWLKIPKWYYKKMRFCGIKYHRYHHEIDETKNLGQVLKIWDKIIGTENRV